MAEPMLRRQNYDATKIMLRSQHCSDIFWKIFVDEDAAMT
jgi:hypothetical protein